MKSQRYLLLELEQVQEELKAISMHDRLTNDELRLKYRELEKKEAKLGKKLYYLK